MNNIIRLCNIAGYCPEEAIWKMAADLCNVLQQSRMSGRGVLSPTNLLVDGETFLLEEGADSDAFLAPEHTNGQAMDEAEIVWAIGAAIYYASSGRLLFGGKGGQYQAQHPCVALPSLQKNHCRLTPVMQRCLCANPTERISMKELEAVVRHCHEECCSEKRIQAAIDTENKNVKVITIEDWPEEMIEQ